MSSDILSAERIRELRQADEDERCEKLLADCVKLCRLEVPEKPDFDPPEVEGVIIDIAEARAAAIDLDQDIHEPDYWDDARVWRDLYLHTWYRGDKMRQIAQNLDDALDEEIKLVEEHNDEIDALNAAARRLQLDLGL